MSTDHSKNIIFSLKLRVCSVRTLLGNVKCLVEQCSSVRQGASSVTHEYQLQVSCGESLRSGSS